MLSLEGRVALVSGGSRGIGRATSLLLARLGARLVVGYRSDSAAAEALGSEIEQNGGQVALVAGDLAVDADAAALVDTAVERFGRLDCVVANHGIWKPAPLLSMSPEQWDETLAVNLRGAWSLARHGARAMAEGGSLVLIASTAGQRGEAGYSHYAASKGGLIALTRSLATELAPRSIRVNGIAPGWVLSDMTRGTLAGPAGAAALRGIPMGRFGTPEDVAGAVAFLISDLAAFVYGEVLPVNGGSVMAD